MSHEAMRLNILHIALLTSISCLLQLADTADCQHTVVDESIDCFGFAHDHGKLSLQGVQLVDKDNGKWYDMLIFFLMPSADD